MNRIIFFFLLPFFGFGQSLHESLHLGIEQGLLQNTVWALEEDYANQVWIGTQEGLQIYDGYNLTTFPEIKETIFGLYHIDSTMYCLTLGNLYKINEISFQVKKVKLNESDYYYHSFSKSKLAITSSDGLKTANFDLNLQLIDSIPNPKSGKFECDEQLGNFHFEGNNNGINYYKIHDIKSDLNGVVIQRIKESHKITSKYCTQILKYDDNHIFISSHDGLLEVINENDSLVIRHHFTNHRIERLMVDQNKNIWVGTADFGALFIHRNTILSSLYNIKNSKNENLTCWNIFEMKGEMFVATSEGVRPLTHAKFTTGLNLTNKFNCLTVMPTENFILVGTGENGIFKLKDNVFSKVYSNPKEALDNTVIQIIKNALGYLAISKWSFIQLDNEGSLVFSKKYSFKNPHNYVMFIDSIDSGYRVSTVNGSYLLDEKLDIISQEVPVKAKVISMTTSFQGDVWASSFDSGIVNLSTGKVLSSNLTGLNCLTISNHNNTSIWASSNTGIYQYTPPFIRVYSQENGFEIGEYNQMSVYKNVNDELYFGGSGAVLKFYPDSLGLFPAAPVVMVERNGRRLDSLQSILLNFDQAELHLGIHPVLISDKNLYKIEVGIDTSWFEITSPITKSFQIPFGSSSILINITDLVHQTTSSTVYQINRAIPFWKELWFMVLSIITLVLLMIGLISFIGFVKAKKQLRLEKSEREINEERLRISKELHDNIGARLTHIISSLDVEMYRNNENTTSIENINSFARDTMAQLRETIWAVSDKTIFFSEFVTRIEQYVDQINELASQRVLFSQEVISDFELNPVQTINYYRIVQEAINNAVKYSKADEIGVRVFYEESDIVIEILDNGIGFDTKSTRFGTGLKGMKSRANEVGGLLEINSIEKEGTSITIKLKFK